MEEGMIEEEERLLIECPECSKEFSLDPSLVAGKKSARFKCQGCSTVFSVDFEDAGEDGGTAEAADGSATAEVSMDAKTDDAKASDKSLKEETQADAKDENTGDELADTWLQSGQADTEMPSDTKAEDIIAVEHLPLSRAQKGIFAALPLCFLMAIVVLSYSFSSEPASAYSASNAPAGLSVNGLVFKDAESASTKGFHVISGRVANLASSSYKDVVVEGSLFDSAGNFINSARFRVMPDLENSEDKISSFGAMSERELEEVAQNYILRPGESLKFSLPMMSPQSIKPGYFSARIISAKAAQ